MKKSLRQYKNRCLSDYGITAQQAEPQQDTTNDLKVIFKSIYRIILFPIKNVFIYGF